MSPNLLFNFHFHGLLRTRSAVHVNISSVDMLFGGEGRIREAVAGGYKLVSLRTHESSKRK
jgi:hypothetical protein